MPNFADDPGLLYVAATLIPLLAFFAMLTVGGIKNLARTYKESAWGSSLFWLLGGDRPGKAGAYVATGAIGLACILSFIGLARFLGEFPVSAHGNEAVSHPGNVHGQADEHSKDADHAKHDHKSQPHDMKRAWAGRLTWAGLTGAKDDQSPAIKLDLGYYIDHCGAVMFAMVAFVATLIHIF